MQPLTAPLLNCDIAAVWARARDRAGIKQEVLASLMGITHAQLANALAGRSHLSLQRVLLITADPDGRVFLRYFAMGLAEEAGMNMEAVLTITRIERVAARLIDRVQKRVPVKAGLRDEQQKKEIA